MQTNKTTTTKALSILLLLLLLFFGLFACFCKSSEGLLFLEGTAEGEIFNPDRM